MCCKDRFDRGLHGCESCGGGVARGHGYARLKNNDAFGVDEAGGDFGSADVNAKRKCASRVHSEVRRSRTRFCQSKQAPPPSLRAARLSPLMEHYSIPSRCCISSRVYLLVSG